MAVLSASAVFAPASIVKFSGRVRPASGCKITEKA
jgi:hypothetical protein